MYFRSESSVLLTKCRKPLTGFGWSGRLKASMEMEMSDVCFVWWSSFILFVKTLEMGFT